MDTSAVGNCNGMAANHTAAEEDTCALVAVPFLVVSLVHITLVAPPRLALRLHTVLVCEPVICVLVSFELVRPFLPWSKSFLEEIAV